MLTTDHLAASGKSVSHPVQHAIETGSLPLAASTLAASTAVLAFINTQDATTIAVLLTSSAAAVAVVIERYYRARKDAMVDQVSLLERLVADRDREIDRLNSYLTGLIPHQHGSGEWAPPRPKDIDPLPPGGPEPPPPGPIVPIPIPPNPIPPFPPIPKEHHG